MSTPAAFVRPAERDDRDAIWPLARAFATSFRPVYPAFARTYEALLGNPAALLAAAEVEGVVVGYLLAFRHDTFLANFPVVWVEELMVAAGSRDRGIGRALMVAAEDWAALHQAAYVSLASRRAGDFYRALGYEESASFFKKTLSPGGDEASP